STSPWTLGVQASSASFVNGSNTVPVGIVSVGNVAGQSVLVSKALSTSVQTITAASQPAAIGQTVGVQYSISGANAATLISKPSGTYTTTVTYILTAL
ncbi:MAG: hypothetical protein JST68_12090, partial [Bacteroidetes bacterium]|nr:hypothetical protein [Bacteroidota bacterium]